MTVHAPARLTPLHAHHLRAGAVMADVAGWKIVQHYGDADAELGAAAKSAGVCDISGRTTVRIKSFELDGVLGARSPEIGSLLSESDTVLARLTADEMLAIGPPSVAGSWHAGISPEGNPPRYVTDVTSGLMGMKIVGPQARDVVASLTDLDLRDLSMPHGSCAQAGFVQVHGTLLRLDVNGVAAYELYVAREFGVYVWEAVLESLGHNPVAPFGHEALQTLERGQ